MDDELRSRLEAWEAPDVPDRLDERMEHLFALPPTRLRQRPLRLWPVVAFGGCVATLVWSTTVRVGEREPRVGPSNRGQVVVADAATEFRGPTAHAELVPARDGERALRYVPLVTRLVLEGYVAIPASKVVVERRSR
jgi:hypothetical protein